MVTRAVCIYRPRRSELGVTTVQEDTNPLVAALTGDTQWYNPTGNKLVIPVTLYNPTTSNSWSYLANSNEILAIERLSNSFDSFLNADFQFNVSNSSNFVGINFVIAQGVGSGILGFAQNPGANSFMGVPYSVITIYHDNYQSGPNSNVATGGADYSTYIHEFGHALGLQHPHEISLAGGGFPGVNGNPNSRGDFALNQGINTIMGYNNGWQTGPLGPSTSTEFGFQATPMALDILALQKLYGANLTYNSGNDFYQLASTNGGYSCIWDAGGNDTIAGSVNNSNNIDLRPATGLVEQGGGGWVSYVAGLQGGFTIAVGVIIENAVGGNYSDVITGNNASNNITGGGGADILTGGNNRDTFIYNSISDSTLSQPDRINDFTDGYDKLDFSQIDANTNLDGNQAFQLVSNFTAAGQIYFFDNSVDTFIYANINSDLAADFCIKLVGHHVLTSSDVIL